MTLKEAIESLGVDWKSTVYYNTKETCGELMIDPWQPAEFRLITPSDKFIHTHQKKGNLESQFIGCISSFGHPLLIVILDPHGDLGVES